MKQLLSALVALIATGCVHSQRTLAPIDQPASPPPTQAEPSAPPAQPHTEVYTEPVALPPETPPAQFGTVPKTDPAYAAALDAHDLDGARLKLDQPGAFKGTVSDIYEPSGGKLRILNFDADYRSALAVIVWSEDAGRFADLNALVGKEVLVSGTFIDYNGRTEIVLKSPDQLKLVQ